ncbi:hypothetical protein BH11MYX4_BH11MYX4_26960 [soil metagenome]
MSAGTTSPSESGGEQRLRALVDTMRAFAEATTDYPRLLETVASAAARLMGGGCIIVLLSDDGQWVRCGAVAAADEATNALLHAFFLNDVLPIGEVGPLANVVRTGVPVLIPSIEPHALAAQVAPRYTSIIVELGIHSALSVPLQVLGTMIGGLGLYRFKQDSAPFGTDDLAFAAGLADHAALALSNARLLESAQLELAERRRAEEEKNQLEVQLRQAQKMEAVGRLAGGIAHDFNNLLTVILSYAAILKSTLPADGSADESLEEIEIAGERAAALTRQLLVFSRQQVLELRVLDLNRVVLEMQTIARTLLTENVELVVALGEDVGRIEVDQSQVEQVIVNLVVNARDAMPDGGVLTVATKRVVLDAEQAARVGIVPGAFAVLVASDTGVGIDEAAKPYLFEPFFTTKEAGKGTGLGLATILGIVKQGGGHITVESERGKGATFQAYFPRVELPLSTSPAKVSPLPATGGNERILLVEDDAQVRALMRNVLRRAGYDVIDARSPEEALVEDARVAGELPLLVTDVILPKMSGRELAERFLERRPDAKVLYVSGYTEDVIGQHGVLVPGIELLRKPITPELLLRRVRSVLDS